jgi:hypothetical protein
MRRATERVEGFYAKMVQTARPSVPRVPLPSSHDYSRFDAGASAEEKLKEFSAAIDALKI